MCTHRIVCQFFLIISIALTACQPQFKTIDPPAQQFEFSGFSFLSPDEKDWTLNERTSNYVNLGKLEKIDDTIVINAGLIYSPETADWDDLRQLLNQRTLDQSLSFIDIDQLEYKGAECFHVDMEQSDLQPTRPSGGEGEMTVHTIELICPHPDNPAYLILLSYSHRFNPDDPDPEFINRAQALFSSLEINEIK